MRGTSRLTPAPAVNSAAHFCGKKTQQEPLLFSERGADLSTRCAGGVLRDDGTIRYCHWNPCTVVLVAT
jgi:hypothetical protein